MSPDLSCTFKPLACGFQFNLVLQGIHVHLNGQCSTLQCLIVVVVVMMIFQFNSGYHNG